MYPTVIFPICTISLYGGEENQIFKENTDNHISFKARENYRYGENIQPIRIFNAWGDVADRIRKMNLKRGSEVTIIAQLKSYRNNNGLLQDSYNVMSIDFIRTNQYQAKDKEKGEEKKPVQIEQPKEPAQESEKKEEGVHVKPTVELDKERSMIDMNEFEKMLGI